MRFTSILPVLLLLFTTSSILADQVDFINNGLKPFDEKVQDEFENKNHVYSPMAIRVMATALMRGVSGQALQELADAFGFDLGDDINNPNEGGYLTYMQRTFEREKPNLQQSIIWASEKYYNLNSSYRDDIRERCGIQLKRIKTFVGKEGYLNQQVSKGTDGAISDFFEKGSMTEEVKLLMLNSLKFDEKWHKKLQMKKGKRIKFYNLDKEFVKEVDTFKRGNKDEKVIYYKEEDTGLEYIWLPFQPHNKKQPQMVFALPRYANESHYEANPDFKSTDLFDDVDFAKARSYIKERKAKRVNINLIIPKFKFNTNLPLTGILKSLGIETVFDNSKTPFTRLFNKPKGLYLSEAVHKATIEVDEVGAKASAATAIKIESRMNARPFVLDRPFKFFITNKRMANVYFTGIVHKP